MIEGIDNAPSTQGFGTSINSAAELQTDFLNLLIAQLANQDPLSPMDNEAMVQQLATFSQLEQLERVNSNLETQMGFTQSLNNTMMMDVAGKRVTVLGNEVSIDGGQPSRTLVRVPDTGLVYARVLDEDGVEVRSLDAQEVQAGFNPIEWDGRDKNGDALPDGDYSIEISATNRDGAFMKSATFSSGIVETIQFDNNFIYLVVNGRVHAPSDVVEVGVSPNQVVSSGSTSELDVAAPEPTPGPWWSPTSEELLAKAGDTFDASRSPWEALLQIR